MSENPQTGKPNEERTIGGLTSGERTTKEFTSGEPTTKELTSQRVVDTALTEALQAMGPQRRWAEPLARALGCGCPDEVFQSVRFLEAPLEPPGLNVEIGHKLLLGLAPGLLPRSSTHGTPHRVLDTDRGQATLPKLRETLRSLLVRGRDLRDREGLNRFRLVLLVDSSAKEVSEASIQTLDTSLREGPGLRALLESDEKLHLHVMDQGALRLELGGALNGH